MGIKERLRADVRDAMRAKEAGRLRLGVLRLALAAIQRLEVDARREIDDDEVLAVLAREMRQRQDTLAEIAGRGRQDAEAKIAGEIDVLRAYLPQPLAPEELEALAQEVVRTLGASSLRDLGRVMAALMPRVRGRATGDSAQLAVRRLLGG